MRRAYSKPGQEAMAQIIVLRMLQLPITHPCDEMGPSVFQRSARESCQGFFTVPLRGHLPSPKSLRRSVIGIATSWGAASLSPFFLGVLPSVVLMLAPILLSGRVDPRKSAPQNTQGVQACRSMASVGRSQFVSRPSSSSSQSSLCSSREDDERVLNLTFLNASSRDVSLLAERF